MNIEFTRRMSAKQLTLWRELIEASGLVADSPAENTALVYDGDELVATGGRDGCVLKLIAVADSHRGEDLTAAVLTELRRDAFSAGYSHLFLYTKPENRYTFESLMLYPVIESSGVLVMENKRDGLASYLASLPERAEGKVGALVMNCDPFTLGHRALVERAASECDRVFLFVLSEDGGRFSPEARLEMVRRGTADLAGVTVIPTGPYLISRATFPTYFIKDRDRADTAACEVDIEIFTRHLAPRLGITRRYVGTEPLSPLTAKYNAVLEAALPKAGIMLTIVDRKEQNGTPISASRVRELIEKRDTGALSTLVPDTTLDYLTEHGYI